MKGVSVTHVQRVGPDLGKVGGSFMVSEDRRCVPRGVGPVFGCPLQLSKVVVSVHRGNSTGIGVGLQRCSVRRGSLVVYTPNSVLRSVLSPNVRLSRVFLVSSSFLGRVCVGLGDFVPFFVSLGRGPGFRLVRRRMRRLGSFCRLVRRAMDQGSGFEARVMHELVKTCLCGVNSVLREGRPRFLSRGPGSLGERRMLFGRFVGLLARRRHGREHMSFCTRRLFLDPGRFSAMMGGIDKGATKR